MAKYGMFNNPIAPTEKKSGREFVSPSYDNRSGQKVPAGDYYGTGFKAKVGKMRGDSVGERPVPMKSLCVPPTTVV